MVPTSQKISFYYPESKIKDFVEKDISNRPKKAITGRESPKNDEKNSSHQPENQLSTSKNKLFLWKLFVPNSNNVFY